MKGIKSLRIESEEKAVGILIGNDMSEAHRVFEEIHTRRKQSYAVRAPLSWRLIGRLDVSSSAKEALVKFIRGGQPGNVVKPAQEDV